MIETWLPKGGWPADVLDAVRRFRQGHILKWNSLAYGANFESAICSPTSEAGGEGLGYTRIDEPWQHGIITTQTCDVCEDGRRKPKMPWISVAPVYNILPLLAQPGQDNQIRTNGFTYLVPLTHPKMIAADQLWVADLRVEYPLEKGVLVSQIPVEAFEDEAGYADFADKLARRRNRPAIDSRVREFITVPLGDALRRGQIPHDQIIEMRLQVAPVWDRVERAKLYAIVKDAADIVSATEKFTFWEMSIASSLPPDLTLLPSDVVTIGSLRHRLCLETVRVDYDDVSA